MIIPHSRVVMKKVKNKMSDFKFKFQMYKHLQENIVNIYSDAKKAADEIRIPKDLKGKFGLTGAISGCHGIPHKEVIKAMDEAATKIIPNKILDDEVRGIVKDVYGDDYDGLTVNTCEDGLWLNILLDKEYIIDII